MKYFFFLVFKCIAVTRQRAAVVVR